MNRDAFDIVTFPLNGLRLIEASAGTGKTFSLAGLYLRLLLEQQLDVRQILVLTFTRAATQELRERIRTLLATAARLAADPAQPDSGAPEHQIALALIDAAAAHEPRERTIRRLRDAASRMDEATISTIHSFAQQAALENAFDSGLPFDRGTQVDDAAVTLDAVTDYWRSQVLGRSAGEAAAFLIQWPNPAKLIAELGPALGKPHLDLWGPATDQLDLLAAQARRLWREQRQHLLELLERAAAHDALLKSGDLYNVIVARGGVDALISEVEAGLAGTASGCPALPAWLTSLSTAEGTAVQFKKRALGEYRPQDLELIQALAALAPIARSAMIRTAFTTVRAAIRERKRAARQFSFADMVEALHEAIIDPIGGAALADALHRTWPYALVDEFQDTDPLQYDILRATYQGRESGALIMIGDPKQAIYGFRGGDVFAYLQAARDADGRYGLDTNFRSTQGLLDGIEALFLGPSDQTAQGSFLIPEIRFHHVYCGRKEDDRALLQHGKRLAPITAWVIDGAGHRAADGRTALLDATVTEICALLATETGARLRLANGTETPVRPADIAVLVNTNREAASVQRALARRGIPAVCLHRASVFDSEQALDLLYVLRAADSSARPEAVRAALSTPLLGMRMGELLILSEDESAWHQQVARFQAAHERWHDSGVLALLEPLLQEAAPRVLALEDGERRMTNYLQLGELLAQAERETFGFTGLIRWLGEQIDEPGGGSESDAQQLRLESDDALVRIATVHRVKGLQYPIVFVPFTPSLGAKKPSPPWVFHDGEQRAWLDFALEGTEHNSIASREARAESLRLLYVALTRAEQACYVGWGALKNAQNAALAWLLHAEDGMLADRIDDPNAKLPDWLTAERTRARLDALAARSRGTIRVLAPPQSLPVGFRHAFGGQPDGHAREDLPGPRPDWSVFSFSRLVAGGKQQTPGTGVDDESPDSTPVERVSPADDWATIPLRGPAFGVAIHQLLEDIDPATWPAPDVRPEDSLRARVANYLNNAGLPVGSDSERVLLLNAVAGMVSRALHTPLPEIGPIAAIPGQRRLIEMEFFLTLGGGQTGQLLDFIGAHGYGASLLPERRLQTLNGLMQGFIDLTVEADGRYWIIDYKTNDLGSRPEDYNAEALTRAVSHGHYDLQYLIYLIALHRHLDRTLPGYDPASHLGGAQYLFLRGMNGRNADFGVFRDSPSPDFIVALDDWFTGASHTA